MTPTRTYPLARVFLWGTLAASILLFLVLITFNLLSGEVSRLLSTVVQSVTVGAAAILLLRQARRTKTAISNALRLTAAALICAAASGLLVLLLLLATGEYPDGFLTIPDLVYFAAFPLAVAALLAFPTSRHVPGSTLRSLLDGALAGTGLWLCIYFLWLLPIQLNGSLPTEEVVRALAYPALDAAVIGIALSVVPRVSRHERNRILWLSAGLTLWAISDLGYVVASAAGTYESGTWISALGEAGLLLLCVGALNPAIPGTSHLLKISSVLPFLPVIAAWLLSIWIGVTYGALTQLGAVTAEILVGLLLLRMWAGWRDRIALTRKYDLHDRLFHALVTESFDAVAVIAATGETLFTSPAVTTYVGTSTDTSSGRALLGLVHPDDRNAVQQVFTTITATPGTRGTITIRLQHNNGDYRWISALLHNMSDDDAVNGIVIHARDVHDETLLTSQLEHAATHDTLTGLANLAHIKNLLHTNTFLNGHVLLVDLDRFKHVNDTYGHSVGDATLKTIAGRLQASVEPGSVVARIGGDEFLIAVPTTANAHTITERIGVACRIPIQLPDATEVIVPASVGVAHFDDTLTVDDVVRNADLAMYAAKSSGRDTSATYTDNLHTDTVSAMTVVAALRDGIAGRNGAMLTVRYHPIVNINTGTVDALEALVRLELGDGTVVTPDVFIPVAEDLGVISAIGRHVIAQVCTDLAKWNRCHVNVGPVAINVSRRQLQPGLATEFSDAAKAAGVDVSQLSIELTESCIAHAGTNISTVLASVAGAGMRIALDDFGVGQSSLAQLSELPVDIAKLDRRFAQACVTENGRAAFSSAIRLCNDLGLTVIVEGVETQTVADLATQSGAHLLQGFYFTEPLRFTDVEPFLATFTTPRLTAHSGTP